MEETTRELTKYRAVRKGSFNYYHLQFATYTEKRTFWGRKYIKEFWQDIPSPAHSFLGFMSRTNSHNLANKGYGYCLKSYDSYQLNGYVNRYPYIEDFISEFNRGHQKWIDRQAEDQKKPVVINF